MSLPEYTRWRVGRRVGRTIYTDEEPSRLIGVMDTRALAAEVIRAHNDGIPERCQEYSETFSGQCVLPAGHRGIHIIQR